MLSRPRGEPYSDANPMLMPLPPPPADGLNMPLRSLAAAAAASASCCARFCCCTSVCHRRHARINARCEAVRTTAATFARVSAAAVAWMSAFFFEVNLNKRASPNESR
jgi:hypothetical protein